MYVNTNEWLAEFAAGAIVCIIMAVITIIGNIAIIIAAILILPLAFKQLFYIMFDLIVMWRVIK